MTGIAMGDNSAPLELLPPDSAPSPTTQSAVPQPTTPPQPTTLPAGRPSSTPVSTQRTSSRGPSLVATTHQTLAPPFEADLMEQATTATLRNFLIFLLAHALPEKDYGRARLEQKLEELTTLAFEICNTRPDPASLQDNRVDERKDGMEDSVEPINRLQHRLLDYRQVAGSETSRYKPFADLANAILEELDSHSNRLENLGLTFTLPEDRKLIFQRNDPRRMQSRYIGRDSSLTSNVSERSPDIVAVPLDIASSMHETGSSETPDIWKTHAANFAGRAPTSGPDFYDIRMALEFKKGRGSSMPKLPTTWRRDKDIEVISPQHVSFMKPRASEPRASVSTSASSSAQVKSSSRGSKQPSEDAAHLGNSSRKRHHDSSTYDLNTNPPPHFLEEEKLPPPIQAAINAGERLSSSVAIKHAFNAVVDNHHMWLWWYERGGIVQSHGLDIIKDFPYLVVLLAIIKHFDEQAWGFYRDVFQPSSDNKNLSFSLGDAEFQITAKWAPQYLTLCGRGTAVRGVKILSPHPLAEYKSLNKKPMVAKIYWPEEKRTSEIDLLHLAYAIGSKDDVADDIRGHLPVLVASGSWPNKYRENLDDLLRVAEPRKRISRCLRILVFYKLTPISELSGDVFFKAWLDCFRCHWALWKNGLHHRDISANNLMYTVTADDKVVGVLNDFDLAIMDREAVELASERTGTVAFMAHALLMNVGQNILHIYDYDAESFVYVLLWITRRFGTKVNTVQVVDHKVFWEWDHGSRLESAEAKKNALIKPPPPTSIHNTHDRVVRKLAKLAVMILSENALVRVLDTLEDEGDDSESSEGSSHTHWTPKRKTAEARHNSYLKVIRKYSPLAAVERLSKPALPTEDRELWTMLTVKGQEGRLWKAIKAG